MNCQTRQCNRADLLLCFRHNNTDSEDCRRYVAALLGFSESPFPITTEISVDEPVVKLNLQVSGTPEIDEAVTDTSSGQDSRQLNFWRIDFLQQRSEEDYDQISERPDWVRNGRALHPDDTKWPGTGPPSAPTLLPWRRLWPFLRYSLGSHRPSRQPDLTRILPLLARRRWVRRLPRCQLRCWSPQVMIILDCSARLVSFRDDYRDCVQRLKLLRGTGGLTVRCLKERQLTKAALNSWLPVRGTRVLVLGDLGCLEAGSLRSQFWEYLGKVLASRFSESWALMPCPRDRWLPALANYWKMSVWDCHCNPIPTEPLPSTNKSEIRRAEQVKGLLSLISPALRIEPQFLHALRLQLSAVAADCGTEYDVWSHPALRGGESVKTPDPEAAAIWRQSFSHIDADILVKFLKTIKKYHGYVSKSVQQAEILNISQSLSDELKRKLVDSGALSMEECDEAGKYQREIIRAMLRHQSPWEDRDLETWSNIQWRHLKESRKLDELGVQWALSNFKGDESVDSTNLPVEIESDSIAWTLNRSKLPRFLELYLVGVSEYLQFSQDIPNSGIFPQSPRFPLLQLETRDSAAFVFFTDGDGKKLGRVVLPLTDESGGNVIDIPDKTGGCEIQIGPSRYTGKADLRPDWARRIGRDRYGLYADLRLQGLGPKNPLRLRWIPPGHFLMGSPENEVGRFDNREGPQHHVVLSQGFWLAESPCTQTQWEIVMGNNPSNFSGGNRPVGRVSWKECQEFFIKLDEQFSGLFARFPTEAEWEYSCRAGSVTAFNNHKDCSMASGSDPAMNDVGWYSKNSDEETHDVKLKKPNDWGLYDMHGNVWEWCRDWYGPYKAEEISDPRGPKSGKYRVVRGGSYWSDARYCRSAYRDWSGPESRFGNRGFRLAAGQW